MTEINIHLSTSLKPAQLPRLVERAATAEQLTLTLKGTLAKYPGCTHWHYQQGKQPGTLEITWYPRERRLWFKIARNRNNGWIEVVVPRLKRLIESNL